MGKAMEMGSNPVLLLSDWPVHFFELPLHCQSGGIMIISIVLWDYEGIFRDWRHKNFKNKIKSEKIGLKE